MPLQTDPLVDKLIACIAMDPSNVKPPMLACLRGTTPPQTLHTTS